MTSSLVGSEMCIRDSMTLKVCPRMCGGTREEGQPQPVQAEYGTIPRGSVSYTHLTLPTICSV
eukprot:1688514-Prorocentrum_lima.AAC.1